MNSKNVLISNVTFLNSPFWTMHHVYCSHVTVQNVTILAPFGLPNTDGIDSYSLIMYALKTGYISVTTQKH
ncbi:putative galacturan 1,4-alpha-galacturonidase [Medicago truncatula]|nr:putative galacturan 1,4-alpha-galacturonidase [Medicago truncatula]